MPVIQISESELYSSGVCTLLMKTCLGTVAGKKNSSRVSWSEEEKKWNCPWATLQTKTEETKKENPWAKYKKVAAESMEKSESVKPISDKKETNPSNNSERRPWQGRCHDEQD